MTIRRARGRAREPEDLPHELSRTTWRVDYRRTSDGIISGAAVAQHYPARAMRIVVPVVPGYEALNWHGIDAPARTPRAIVARLYDETTRILRQPDVQDKLNGLSMDVVASRPEEYRAFIKAQTDQWAPLVKASGARLN